MALKSRQLIQSCRNPKTKITTLIFHASYKRSIDLSTSLAFCTRARKTHDLYKLVFISQARP